jgi:uncharacterized protein (DUF2147 family)
MRLIAERAWVRRPHIAVLIAFCALGLDVVLAEEPGMPGIEGRWENAKQDLVLDVARCGERYCGRIVTSGDQCAQTVLTVSPKAASAQVSQAAFEGELALPDRGRPYKARVTLTAAGKMQILGDDVEPSFVRRSFPFHALLARVGDARCRSNPTS